MQQSATSNQQSCGLSALANRQTASISANQCKATKNSGARRTVAGMTAEQGFCGVHTHLRTSKPVSHEVFSFGGNSSIPHDLFGSAPYATSLPQQGPVKGQQYSMSNTRKRQVKNTLSISKRARKVAAKQFGNLTATTAELSLAVMKENWTAEAKKYFSNVVQLIPASAYPADKCTHKVYIYDYRMANPHSQSQFRMWEFTNAGSIEFRGESHCSSPLEGR